MKKIIDLILYGFFFLTISVGNAEPPRHHPVETHHEETHKVETVKTPDHTVKTTEVRTETTTKEDDKTKTVETKKITETHETDKEVKKHDEEKDKTIAEKTDDTKDKKPLVQQSSQKIDNDINTYFQGWLHCDKDCSNKTLTYHDILKLIEDKNISGQEAAVLAAIVTYINGLSNPNSVKYTLTELKQLFSSNTGSIFSWYYQTAITNINKERALPDKDKLFGRTQDPDGKWHSGITKDTQIIQNGLGDCFTLSSINGMLNLPGGPEKLEGMITAIPGHPDEYWVNFPGYSKPIFVVLTPTKLAMYSELANGGKWLAIMSDAVSRAERDNPESGIFDGGYQTFILHLLTGKDYRNEALSPFSTEQVKLLKSLDDKQYKALLNILDGSTNAQLQTELQSLTSLTPEQLKSELDKGQLDAFKQLSSSDLALLASLTPAQWNEVKTLIYSNQGNVNLKLLDRSLKANRTESEYSEQLNKFLNNDKPPHIVGIETNEHDLTVVAYNPSTQTLTIKNPWGDTGWYNPVTGAGPDNNMPKDGSSPPWYDMKNGIFTANLTQLVQSGLLTITIPVERSDDETKKLAEETKNADHPGGQIGTLQTQITQAEQSAANIQDPVQAAQMQAVIKEARDSLTHLIDACKKGKGCQTTGVPVSVCQEDLANAGEAATNAQNKLSTSMQPNNLVQN